MNDIACRVCLIVDANIDAKCISLFEAQSEVMIADKINWIANIGIQAGDGLPDRICPDCLINLENAISFKNKCEESNLILHGKIYRADSPTTSITVKEEIPTDTEDYDTYDDVIHTNEIKSEVVTTEKPVKVYSKSVHLVQCDDCNDFFKSKCKLRMHWKKVHLPGRLICDKCKRVFKSYKALNFHKRKETQSCLAASKCRIEGKGKTRILHCKECSYKTKRPKDIVVHLRIHSGERKYHCDKCPKVFTQHSSLAAHQESMHQQYKIVAPCHYCGKVIKGRGKLYKHLKRHRENGVQCKICKKILKTREYLDNHMLRHSGVKAYTCEKCAATFYTLPELCNHRKRVHVQARHTCDICGYSLKSYVQINVHKAKHTGTNVICMFCGKFYTNSKELLVHQKCHVNACKYPCPMCDKSFSSSKLRSAHCRIKHKRTITSVYQTDKAKSIGIKQEYEGVSGNEEVITSHSPD